MRSQSNKRKILIIIIGILFILSLNFFKEEVRGFFYSISEKIQKDLWKKGEGSSNFFQAIFRAPSLQKDNENLKLRIQELLSQEDYLKNLENENKMLREAMGLGIQNELRLELAEIIGKDTNENSILIDKGLGDGISKDLLVITSQKALVGAVKEVHQNYSRVLLISDEDSSFEAQISGSDISGLVKGMGGSRVLLDLIPKDKGIKEGDLVVHRGLLVGLIKEIKRMDVSPFQSAEISPFLDVFNTNKVFIVLNL